MGLGRVRETQDEGSQYGLAKNNGGVTCVVEQLCIWLKFPFDISTY